MSHHTAAAAPPLSNSRDGPKVTYFNTLVNPEKPPLLPPKMTQRLIAPMVTAVITALILVSVKPPFVQKRNKKNKPMGDIDWVMVFMWSLGAAAAVLALPFLVRLGKGETMTE